MTGAAADGSGGQGHRRWLWLALVFAVAAAVGALTALRPSPAPAPAGGSQDLVDPFLVGFPRATGDRVATFDGQPVTTGQLQQLVDVVSQNQQGWWNSPTHKQELVDRYALERWFADEARRRGLDRDPLIRAKMAYAARSVLVDALMDQERQKGMEETTARRYFDANRGLFGTPVVTVTAVAFASEAEAARAAGTLKDPKGLDALVAASVDTTTGATRGRLGPQVVTDLPAALQDPARRLAVGALSAPVADAGRWWLVRLDARTGESPWEQVAPAVKLRLAGEAQREFVRSTRAALPLQVDEEAYGRFVVQ